MIKRLATLPALALAVVGTACTVHQSDSAPPLTGPSDFAQSIGITATPDTINQDGGSQSSIVVTVHDASGRPASGVPLRLDMVVDNTLQDFGTLSARNIVTGADGKARAVYLAPPPPPPAGGSVQLVNIQATPNGSDAQASQRNGSSATIRLVPPGVILPPAETPTAAFTITPTPVNLNTPAIFDASASCGGQVVGSVCQDASAITSYIWTFGDGSTAAGKIVSHTFTSSTTFIVTLTVTNSRGLSASIPQSVSVSASPLPAGEWFFSPSLPQVNQTVLFNAEGVRAAPGHTLVSYSWNFGDGATKTGVVATHDFGATGAYDVTLTVTDEVGQKLTTRKTVTVGATTGIPQANFTFSPVSPVPAGTTVTFDGSSSTAANGATIVSYQWTFGDSAAAATVTASPTTSHQYPIPNTYTVSLTVVDSQGRSSSTLTRQIQVR